MEELHGERISSFQPLLSPCNCYNGVLTRQIATGERNTKIMIQIIRI